MHTPRFESAATSGRGWNVVLEGLSARYVASHVREVEAVLSHADRAAREGSWAAVAVGYEAAAAFEPSLPARPLAAGIPLAWVGVYRHGRTLEPLPSPKSDDPGDTPQLQAPVFHPSVSADDFATRVRRAQDHILNGDTYQVNLTFPMHASGLTDVAGWYDRLRNAQQAPYAACLEIGEYSVLSLSPELFFERRGSRITMRPMKGTTRRGRWAQEDDSLAAELSRSAKTRAENVMIVDLVRNDIGRIACVGTVRVPHLFTTERYPTLWQMTSTVDADVPSDASLNDVFRALFPCGSVTGAPKIRTMDIIAALEDQPRGLYTGALGFVKPGGDCVFSVAIRTIVVHRPTGLATLGVGAGITADSVPMDEYRECLLKAAFVTRAQAPAAKAFLLLETMRLEGGVIARVERHLGRMADSARYFGRPWDDTEARRLLDDVCGGHPTGCWRLRLLHDADGIFSATCVEHDAGSRRPWHVALAEHPVDTLSPFLFNKTTNRAAYDRACVARPGVDDVLLWNEGEEMTEATRANVVAEFGGIRYTPPVSCGLLAGTFRAELIENGQIRERVILKSELASASRIWLVNSLREWIDVELIA